MTAGRKFLILNPDRFCPIKYSRFREVDFGIFEMYGYEELKDTLEYQQWLTGDNEANVPPQGENGLQMKERVLTAFF